MIRAQFITPSTQISRLNSRRSLSNGVPKRENVHNIEDTEPVTPLGINTTTLMMVAATWQMTILKSRCEGHPPRRHHTVARALPRLAYPRPHQPTPTQPAFTLTTTARERWGRQKTRTTMRVLCGPLAGLLQIYLQVREVESQCIPRMYRFFPKHSRHLHNSKERLSRIHRNLPRKLNLMAMANQGHKTDISPSILQSLGSRERRNEKEWRMGHRLKRGKESVEIVSFMVVCRSLEVAVSITENS